MKIFIKNMVCQGTRKYVLQELKRLGLKLKSFESGEIEFHNELSQKEAEELTQSLKKFGLEVLPLKRKHLKHTSVAFHTPETSDGTVKQEAEMKEEKILLPAVNE